MVEAHSHASLRQAPAEWSAEVSGNGMLTIGMLPDNRRGALRGALSGVGLSMPNGPA